jgi:hypothetical protein
MAYSGKFTFSEMHASISLPARIGEAKLALSDFRRGEFIEINEELVRVGVVFGEGGFKKAYDVGNDKTITVRNTKVDRMDTSSLIRWCEAVYEEKLMADRLRNLGLKTLDHQVIEIKVKENRLPVLYTTSFAGFVSKGLQIRDRKNDHVSTGKSMLFGSTENINPTHFKLLFKDILSDIACLAANGIDLDTRDSFNLCIEDTSNTPLHDRNESQLFTERQQSVRLFFFDFSDKYNKLNIPSTSQTSEKLKATISNLLDTTFDILIFSTTEDERELFGSVYTLKDLSSHVYTSLKNELIEKTVEIINQKLEVLSSVADTSPSRNTSSSTRNTSTKRVLPRIAKFTVEVLNGEAGFFSVNDLKVKTDVTNIMEDPFASRRSIEPR